MSKFTTDPRGWGRDKINFKDFFFTLNEKFICYVILLIYISFFNTCDICYFIKTKRK